MLGAIKPMKLMIPTAVTDAETNQSVAANSISRAGVTLNPRAPAPC